MIKYLIWPWLLFFVVMGLSMMPGYMVLVMVISFIGGLIDSLHKNKRKSKYHKPQKLVIDDFDPVY